MADLRERLRSPSGLLQLFAVVFLGALGIAVVVATQRPFFERLVRENITAPPAMTVELARAIERGEAEVQVGDADALYAVWMRASEPERLGRIPRSLFRAAPDRLQSRVQRTLLAGSATQRARALELVRRACHPAAVRVLRWARTRRALAMTGIDQALRDVVNARTKEGARERRHRWWWWWATPVARMVDLLSDLRSREPDPVPDDRDLLHSDPAQVARAS